MAGCGGSDGTTTGPGTDAVVDTATADVATDTGSSVDGGSDTTVADTATEVATDAKADGNTDATTDTGVVDTGFFPPYGHPPWDEHVV